VAIVNGRRVYDSRKLAAIAEVEDRAAAEYVWMMAGVSDDWGRFRASARTILGEAYRDRPGVTEADVERWLGLYNAVLVPNEEFGLLRFYYDADGVRYAEWTNYMGDPPSQRQHHSCPEPEWSDHEHGQKCRMWRGARPKDAKPAKSPTPKIQQKTTADGSSGHASDPPVPPVPSVPPVTATDKAVGRDAPPNPLVDRDRLCAEGYRLIEGIAPMENLDPTEVLNMASEWKGRGYVRLDSMPHDRLAHTLNALRRWHRKVTGQAEPELPAARAAPAAVTSLTARTMGALKQLHEREAGRDRADGVRGGAGGDRVAIAAAGGSADDRRLPPRPPGRD
jgi:hypothetical protein